MYHHQIQRLEKFSSQGDNKFNTLHPRTLAGNLSLWSVTANAISFDESGRDETEMKHKDFYNFL